MNAQGIDISHHQGTFTNNGKADFIIARTSNGIKEDTKFRLYVPEIKKTVIRGAFHYYRTNLIEHPVQDQADLFLELSSGKGMKILGVDYEVSAYDDNVINAETAIELYGFMLFLATQRPAKKILLYTSIYTWRDILLPLQGIISIYGEIDWYKFGIWLPRYGWADDSKILELDDKPVIPHYDIWQKSKEGWGVDYGLSSTFVDLDEYNGSVKDMLSWLTPEEDDPVKKVWTSKTIIFFVLSLLIAIAGLFGFADFTLTGDQAQIITIVVSVIGIVLRFFTKDPVEL